MEDSRKYETAKYIVSAAGFVLNTILLIYLLVSSWSFKIRDFAEQIAPASLPSMVVLGYFSVIGILFAVLHLPLDFISGYILEHRFGLSRQTRRGWASDQLKGLLLGAGLGLIAAETVYYLLRYHTDRWWIYASFLFVGFFVLIANLAPVLLLPLFFKFTPVENEELRRRIDRLANRAGIRLCGIFEWSLGEKTRKANAAVVGWGNTRRILVSDTLLKNFPVEEIEVILAHEFCHHAKAHIWWGMGLQAVLTFASFFVMDQTVRRVASTFQGPWDVANFPVLALSGVVLSLLVLPGLNAFSRALEKAADRYALDVTGDALAFVSSMEKLADLNLANKSPNKVIEFIFYSHPSIENRIKLAADRVGQGV